MADGYLPSDLVTHYHKWLHVTFDFDQVKVPTSGDFHPNDVDYYQSLLMLCAFFIIPMVIAIVIILFYTIYSCCSCYDPEKNERETRRIYKRLCFCSILFASIAIIVAVAGVCTIAILSPKGDDVINTLRSLNTKYQRTIHFISSVTEGTISPRNIAVNLETELKMPPKDVKQALGNIIDGLSTIDSKATSIMNNAPNILLFDALDEAKTYLHYFRDGQYVVVGIPTLLAFILMVSIKRRARCCTILTLFLGLVAMLFVGAATGGSFGLIVGVADTCFSPKTFINAQIGNSSYSSYYVFCGSIPNPFREDIQQAKTEGIATSQDASTVYEYAMQHAPNFSTQASQLKSDISFLTTTMNGVFSDLECINITPEFDSSIEDACNPFFQGTVVFGWVIFSFCVLFGLVLICAARSSFKWLFQYHSTVRRGSTQVLVEQREGAVYSTFSTAPQLDLHRLNLGESVVDEPSFPINGTGDHPEDGNEEGLVSDLDDNKLECKICFVRDINVSLGCSHALCTVCSENLTECPFCRERIQARHPIIFP
eukprot:m.23565 g.23565  ORF g.23565 m.23565 type:complete len:540 (+) comp5556_c1_seq2:217-1836(+)